MLPTQLSLLNASQNIAVPIVYYKTTKQDIFSEIIYKRLNLNYITNSYRDNSITFQPKRCTWS